MKRRPKLSKVNVNRTPCKKIVFTYQLTFLWEFRRVSRCWCKSWRIETPSSSVSSMVLRLSLILSLDSFILSTDMVNLSLWSADACHVIHTWEKMFSSPNNRLTTSDLLYYLPYKCNQLQKPTNFKFPKNNIWRQAEDSTRYEFATALLSLQMESTSKNY